jgi:hypothetical protein
MWNFSELAKKAQEAAEAAQSMSVESLSVRLCVFMSTGFGFSLCIYIDARESEQLIYISVAIIAYSLCQPPPPPPLLGTFRVFQLGRHAVHNGQ